MVFYVSFSPLKEFINKKGSRWAGVSLASFPLPQNHTAQHLVTAARSPSDRVVSLASVQSFWVYITVNKGKIWPRE